MDENRFEIDGVKYKAVNLDLPFRCDGCVANPFSAKVTCYDLPECDKRLRKDGRDVIFVEDEMDENNFEINGKKYKAVDAPFSSYTKMECKGCVADPSKPKIKLGCGVLPNCVGEDRKDGRNVIFVEDA